jgi:hypothetical protein
VATVYIDYEARAASLKAVTDTIINANKQIGDSAEAAAKEGADAYKAMGKSMSAAFSSQEVSKALNSNIANINKNRDALTKLTGESIKFGKAAITLGGQIKQNAAETLKAKEALANYQKTLQDTNKGTDTTEKRTQSLKGRLRELKEELSALETAGQDGTQAFQKLSIEAGKLQDQIGDTQERVKVLASDTFKFDAAVGAVKGLAAGFAIAQGAAAAFGVDSEDLNKTIARTQGALALLTGLQEIANLVTGQGATKIALQNIFMKEKIVTTTAAAGATTALATAEEGAAVATLATKKSLDLLKIAIAGTGIGLLVLALGALYTIYQRNAEATKRFEDAQKSANDELAKSKITIKELADKQIELDEQLLVSQGKLTQSAADKNKIEREGTKKSIAEIRPLIVERLKLEKIAEEQRQQVVNAQKDSDKLAGIENKNVRKKYDDALRFAKAQLAISDNLTAQLTADINKILQANNKAAATSKGIINSEDAKQAAQDAQDAADKARDNAIKQRELNNKLIEDRLKAELNGLKVLEIANGESTQNKIDQAKKEAEIETANAKASITNAQLRASTIELIDAQLAEKIEQINLDATTKAIESEVKLLEAKRIRGTATIEDEIAIANKTFDIEKNRLQALIDANKATNADLEILTANHDKKVLDIKAKGIQEEYNLRVQGYELLKMLGATTLEDELTLIRARGEAELKANELSNATLAVKEANRLSIIAKTDKQITDAKVVEVNKRIDLENAEAQASLTLGQATYDQRVKLIEDEGQKQINLLDKKLMGEEEYNAAVLKINADTTAKLNAEQDARVDKAFEVANAVLSSFESINEISKIASEQRINDITASSDAELAAINNSDQLERDKIKQREALAKRTQAKINQEKQKQAIKDKALAIFEVGINTASAIVKTGSQLGYPAAIPFQIAAGLVGAAQLAAILATPPPKFEKGGEIGGKRHSQGGTIVEAEQGEYIVNRKQTSTHRRELNALNQSSDAFKKLINERYVRPALMNYMLNSKSKEMGVNVNATLNSKTMESELKGLRKDIRGNKTRFSNPIDTRYQWQ